VAQSPQKSAHLLSNARCCFPFVHQTSSDFPNGRNQALTLKFRLLSI
jgi:hypothetical protein